jgi:hypothetical protein
MNHDDPPRSRKTPFLQPLRKSRFGFDVELEAGEEAQWREWMTGLGNQRFGKLSKMPKDLLKAVQTFEQEVAADVVENAAIWTIDGTQLERIRSRHANQVSLDASLLPASIVSHNHPAGYPPSIEDVNHLLIHGLAELRVVTCDHVFRVQPGTGAANNGNVEHLSGFVRHLNVADTVARRLKSGMKWSEEQTEQAVQHSMLAWLATRHIIRYERTPRT